MEIKKESFFSLKNRYFVYILILIGGVTADIGVLIINSERRALSVTLIVLGGLLLFFSLYLIANDRFNVPGLKAIRKGGKGLKQG